MGVPSGIRRHKIELSGFGMDVGVIDVGGEYDGRVGVLVVVLFWKVDLEFENGVVVEAAAKEYNTVKEAEGIESGNYVDPRWGVLFEVFVFDRDLVIAKSLLSLRLGCNWRSHPS